MDDEQRQFRRSWPSRMIATILTILYGYFAFVAATNLLMLKARKSVRAEWNPAVLVPARNEAERLPHLIPTLVEQGAKVYVYDDGSTDGTAEVASKLGATVIRGGEGLPEGWTGKNHACHQLALVATEDHPGEWILFLDADTRPAPEFIQSFGAAVERSKKPVLTGMPQLIPGTGFEPVYLSWVAWLIAATNPFGLVHQSKMGHNRFLNGQIVAWKKSLYTDLLPHQALKGEILEDVKLGRMLAKQKIPVEVVDVSEVLAVKMYDTLGDAMRGMEKNSADVAGSAVGTFFLAAFMLVTAWAWVFAPWPAVVCFFFSSLLINLKSKAPLWAFPLLPIALTMGAWTCLKSQALKQRGARTWKGRTYS